MVRISSALLQEAKTTGTILSTEALAREKQVLFGHAAGQASVGLALPPSLEVRCRETTAL